MADQLNLFELFEDTFGEDTVIQEVAAAPKKEEKKTPKKSGKEKLPETITLPVTVFASSWKEEISDIDGKTEVTLDELKDYLVNEGYVEIKMSATDLVKEETGVVVSLAGTPSYSGTPFLREEVTVATGQYTMSLNGEADFEGLEKNMGTVAKKWEEQYPQYVGCKIIFDMAAGVGYPIAGEAVEKVPAGTAKYFYNGAVQETELAEEVDADKFTEIVTGVAGGKVYKTTEDVLFVVIYRKSTGKKGSKTTSSSTKTAPKAVVKQKFKLPFKATFTHCDDKEITTEQFPDKEEITEDEFIAWLGSQYEEYTADKTELMYFKADNVVEVRIKSAKRG